MAQKNETQKPKKRVSKLVIIAGVIGLLLVAGIGIGGFLFAGPDGETFYSRFTSEAEASESAIPLEEFLINLQSNDSRNEPVVRMELTVTSLNEEAPEIVGAEIAKVRDAVIHTVSSQSAESLFNEEEGQFIIKDEIKVKINQALNAEIVEDVYITNILLQK
ncbi:MAG: flagellar basal body-associated FliL family protein [Alkalibacterium sp.]|nr:flagellar basal body-associated FliL family protein [Alkalibacterium sp.]